MQTMFLKCVPFYRSSRSSSDSETESTRNSSSDGEKPRRHDNIKKVKQSAQNTDNSAKNNGSCSYVVPFCQI